MRATDESQAEAVESETDFSTVRRVAGAALAGIGGLAVAGEGRVNGQLGAQLGDGVAAALFTFGSGLLLLVAAVAALPAGRRGAARLRAELRGGRLRWWQCLGGVCGAFLVTSQGVTIALLGVAVFTVAVVAGQVVSSLVVDRAGVGPAGRQPLTGPRVAGAALAVVAVGVAVSGDFGRPSVLWLAVLPALAGVAVGWQQAVNGLVRRAAGNTTVAAMVNFAVGFGALLLVFGVDVLLRGTPAAPPGQWWLYTAGCLAIVAIGTSVGAVRLIGVLMVGLCSVSGQLVGSLLLDLFAPTAGHRLGPSSLIGTGLTLVAVGVAAVRTRRADRTHALR
ncbi:DMT family transporter [Solihabitans fulvus]|uniref:DMT family transporter n=1 Tax=Solihabitans fulvus TaxID=1892852 RepID=A0A5B2XP24_9PSEU|nr:DMT family transporter [Solihabitans fulvus]KAA2264619.1 DMT family transporter [Solihabitans fulvus]